jgi:hypothetical protein
MYATLRISRIHEIFIFCVLIDSLAGRLHQATGARLPLASYVTAYRRKAPDAADKNHPLFQPQSVSIGAGRLTMPARIGVKRLG